MEEQIGNALTVMIVGMLTVVFILSLVVFTGKILITILNSTGFKLNKSNSDIDSNEEVDVSQKIIGLAIKKWSGNKATPISIKRVK